MKAVSTRYISIGSQYRFCDWARILTFGPQVFYPLHFIHVLQSLSLLPSQCLLIVIFARSTYAIEENAAAVGVAKEIEDGKYQDDKGCRTEGREHTNEDASTSGPAAIAGNVDDDVGIMRG